MGSIRVNGLSRVLGFYRFNEVNQRTVWAALALIRHLRLLLNGETKLVKRKAKHLV